MVPSRNGPKGAEVASFGLAILMFVLTPTQVGYQDLAALMAQQPAVAARWREHQIASPFGTIHAATFSLPRPVGTVDARAAVDAPREPERRRRDRLDRRESARAAPRAAAGRLPDDQPHQQGRPAGAERAAGAGEQR